MKKRQIIALICSMFFFNLLPFSLPARGQRKVNCGRNPKVYVYGREECLFGTKYNQHGAIYEIGLPASEYSTLYKGKDGDAILEFWTRWGPIYEYGTWEKKGQYYLFYFPDGKIYIPIP